MSPLLGALYRGLSLDEVRRAWRSRVSRVGDARLVLQVEPDADDLVRVTVRPRRGRRLPHRRFGSLVRDALGPEREELAELWLVEPAQASPGALRLEGASWAACLESIGLREVRQLRLWSPLVCPGPSRTEIADLGAELGLELRTERGWVLLAVPHPKAAPEYPPPWKGNYGW